MQVQGLVGKPELNGRTGVALAFDEQVPWIPGVNSSYHVGVDGLSLPLVIMTAVLFLACAVYSLRGSERSRAQAALFLFLQCVSIGLFVAADLILFFVFFDLSIVAMYFVITGWGHGQAGRSAMKFFLYTFLGSLALLVGFIVFTLLTTWAKGRKLMIERMREAAMPIKVFIQSAANSATRVPGTAVFMTSTPEGVPHALLHNLKHNKVLHERVVLLTVKIMDQPFVVDAERVHSEDLGQGFHRMVIRYGFMQDADVPAALKQVHSCGAEFKMMDTSFFLARQTLLPAERPGMMIWREKIFAWMLRNAESAMEFFRLPTNRVVELGSQVEI